MKKYKLIKEYPGHELGEIHTADKGTKWYGTIFYDAYPEFWKKVEEVDYEIISYVTDMANPQSKLRIYSIKRLYDGEVFTIGDSFSGCKNDLREYSTIKSFKVIDEEIKIYNNRNGGYILIKDIIKLPKKTPLFTTEDGVKIYEGDKYWFTDGECYYCRSASSFDVGKTHGFSTKEKAEEYVIFNKPYLSLNDILNAWNGNEHLQNIDDYKQSPLFNNFKKAAEQKQNPKSKGILAQEHINNIETFCTEIKYSIKK